MGLARRAIWFSTSRIMARSAITPLMYTAAIQAAIAAAATNGLGPGGVRQGGIVYFPDGAYLVSESLENPEAGNISFRAPGKWLSWIIGNFAGFVINSDRNVTTLGGIDFIEHLTVVNNRNNVDAGAIRLNQEQTSTIFDCQIMGAIGLYMWENAYCSAVHNCDMQGSGGITDSVGVMMGQAALYNCSITGYEHGVRMRSEGGIIDGCRIEVNRVGIMIGKDQTGATSGATDFSIAACSFERNTIAIDVNSGGMGTISGIKTTGQNFEDDGDATYSLVIRNAFNVVIMGYQANSRVSVAGIGLSLNAAEGCTFISCFARRCQWFWRSLAHA